MKRGRELNEAAERLGHLWLRITEFCDERGWSAELYVREDQGSNFGRIGCRVNQGAGYYYTAWGDTTREAMRRVEHELTRDGFHG